MRSKRKSAPVAVLPVIATPALDAARKEIADMLTEAGCRVDAMLCRLQTQLANMHPKDPHADK